MGCCAKIVLIFAKMQNKDKNRQKEDTKPFLSIFYCIL